MANHKIEIDGVEYVAASKPKINGLKEFSKKVVLGMIVLWFLGAFFAVVVILWQGYGLEALLNYIGYPMGAGIVGYMAKAAFENREKIKKSPAEPEISKGEDHP